METFLLAFVAGIAGILSPCILPMLPIITASALRDSKWGLLALSLGLSLSFALTGSVLTFVLIQLDISTDIFRYIAAYVLGFFALCMLIKPLGDWLANGLSRFLQYLPAINTSEQGGAVTSQFFIGFGMGAIWLPCVGPTLGAAIALASLGEQLWGSFFTMLSYGFGAGLSLSVIAAMSSKFFAKLRGRSQTLRYIMGVSLLVVAVLVISGGDKWLETLALRYLPEWLYGM